MEIVALSYVNIAVKPVTVNFLTGVTMKAQLIVPGSAMRIRVSAWTCNATDTNVKRIGRV